MSVRLRTAVNPISLHVLVTDEPTSSIAARPNSTTIVISKLAI